MEPVVTIAQMRRIEEEAMAGGISDLTLMQNAGAAAARVIAEAMSRTEATASALVLCGPGKNGEDGVLLAERLARDGYPVTAYLYRRHDVPRGVAVVRYEDDRALEQMRRLLRHSTIIVDGLLGTGRARPIEGDLAHLLDTVRTEAGSRVIVALDLPSGVDADTGAADPHSLQATVTISFGFLKRGLLIGDGAQRSGQVVHVGIGLPLEAGAKIALARIEESDVRARLPQRARDANKYSAGAVLVVAGSLHFTGAPQLAALGAARAGAGLVTLATGRTTHPLLAAHMIEPTFLLLDDDEEGKIRAEGALMAIRKAASRYKSLLIGPGLAAGDETVLLVRRLISEGGLPDGMPIVVDAEALNSLATIEGWATRRRYPLILTPHAGEMARLCGVPNLTGGRHPFELAREKAQEWGCVLVLKGQPTVVGDGQGRAVINRTGGPNLASGGTGDVLGGVIAALAAQGASPFDAAMLGAYLHGRAGDVLAEIHGDRGTLASDLLPVLPTVIAGYV